MQWYYAIDGQRFGPVPHAELERLMQAGTVTGEALVWRQGMEQWKALADVQARDPALFSLAPPPLPTANEAAASADVRESETLRSGAGEPVVGNEAAAPVVYAGFWQRLGAHVVDFMLWWFIWQILVAFVGAKYFPEAMAIAEKGPGYQAKPEELIPLLRFLGAVFAVGAVWAVVYDAFFTLRFGATPGKLLLNLRVVQANGRPLGLLRIMVRTFTKGLTGIPTLGIGLLVVAFDEQKRGLHDFFSGTRVVKKR